jgi:hypothetical protein
MLHHLFFPMEVFRNVDYRHIFLLEVSVSFTHNPKNGILLIFLTGF